MSTIAVSTQRQGRLQSHDCAIALIVIPGLSQGGSESNVTNLQRPRTLRPTNMCRLCPRPGVSVVPGRLHAAARAWPVVAATSLAQKSPTRHAHLTDGFFRFEPTNERKTN